MPMSNNGFKWRPNDNSSQTNLRYSLEAEKWVNAVSAAKRKASRGSLSGDLAVISAFLQLILIIPLSILLIILTTVQEIFKLVREKKEREIKRTKMREIGYSESTISSQLDTPHRRRGNLLFFDSRGKLWFVWQFLIWFIFIFSFTFIFAVVLIPLFDPDFNSREEGFLIFTGCVSALFAFIGSG